MYYVSSRQVNTFMLSEFIMGTLGSSYLRPALSNHLVAHFSIGQCSINHGPNDHASSSVCLELTTVSALLGRKILRSLCLPHDEDE